MKRSQMVEKIKEKLEGKPVNELSSGLDFASKLLTFIEELGMIPPSVFKPTNNEQTGYIIKNPNWKGSLEWGKGDDEYLPAMKINEWEPENG